ncbi:MAG TPA: penicillin acylase family protein [Cyclobacteriaceae bacterium]|nr:penicillin acylase family protein [Cyclobacteriaceae bacterium]
MKYVGFFLSLAASVVLAIALSLPMGNVPPIIGLLDPYRGFWQNSYSEDALFRDEIRLANLSAPVEVVYDENLIPHIFAANDLDLFRVQGYVTARHRLWQMEFQTRAAAGRISEIVGSQAIEFDRMQRRKGLGFGAEAGFSFLQAEDPETLQKIAAYTEGVNQYIDQLSVAELPVEYKLLNYKPEPWTPYKTLLLLKYMADMLVGDKDVEFTNLYHFIGPAWMERLFPDYPAEIDPIIESSQKWNFVPLDVEAPPSVAAYPDTSLLASSMPSPPEGTGSNNWAVADEKTRNGHPILANDPHLSLNMPSLWFAMQLSTPEFSVKGSTIPGALGIISGFNQDISWGVTNAARDVRDWYKIKFKDGERKKYLYNDQWVESSFRIEEIVVKNRAPFIDTVVYTHHGPVVYDRNFGQEHQHVNFALKWTAHDGSNEQRTFLELNKGKNHQDFIAALNHFTSPAQNFAFAGKGGDIAMKVQGKFPLKWKGQGKFVMDGNHPAYEWQGFIPNAHNPATLNPARGFASSANQHPVDQSYPYYVFDQSYEHYRNRRINRRLDEMKDIRVEDMQALQLDNFHLHAAEALPAMLAYIAENTLTAAEAEIFDQLRNWDYHADPGKPAPALFEEWWEQFEEAAWGKWKHPGRPIIFPNRYQTTRLLLEDPESAAFDQPSPVTETARHLVAQSFSKTVEVFETWRQSGKVLNWANYKNTSLQHLVPNFSGFGYQNIHTGGGKGMVNATGGRHGASWRMVVEMGDEIRAFAIYPGGQSGNPGSRFYGNMVQPWAEGRYLNFNLRDRENQEDVLFRSQFTPD